MHSLLTQHRLAYLIQTIAESEQKLEIIRNGLAEQPSFEPYSAFRRVDVQRNGFLSIFDIKGFLNESNILLSDREILSIFTFLDTNKDGKITYNDFIKTVLPRCNIDLKEISLGRQTYYIPPDTPLVYEVEWSLTRVFEEIAKSSIIIQNLRESLNNSLDFNIREAFSLIDIENKKFIDSLSLQSFMKNIGKPMTSNEISAFFKVADRDEDGKITFSEFLDIILPNPTTIDNKTPIIGNSLYKCKVSSQKTFDRLAKKADKFDELLSESNNKLSRFSMELYKNPNINKNDVKTIERKEKTLSRLSLETMAEKNLNNNSIRLSFDDMKNKLYEEYIKNQYYNTPKRIAKNYERIIGITTPKNLIMPIVSEQTEKKLAHILKNQIEKDRELEELKKELALRSDFNLLDSFRILDKKGRGYITKVELKETLNEMGLAITIEALELFFERYDKEFNGLLKFSNFCEALTPQNEGYSILMNKRESNIKNNEINLEEIFSYSTKIIYKRLLKILFENELAIEDMRKRLSDRKSFKINEIFNYLDKDDEGYLKCEDFQKALNKYGIYTTKNELNSLVKRYDRDEDGRVSLKEFLNEINPKSPEKKFI